VVVMEEAGMVMERSAVGEVVVEDEEEKRLDLRRKTCTLGIYPKSTHRSGNTGEKEGAVQRQRECKARDHSLAARAVDAWIVWTPTVACLIRYIISNPA
jgi:hypothetical protein